jgi:hypothetical protein
VNSAGLVELVPYNLLTYSEQFENAIWQKQNTSVITNATIAPNGTLTADKLNENGVNGYHSFSFPTGVITTTNPYTCSFYAKAAERTWCSVYLYDGTAYEAFFDLVNGVVGSVASGMTATITNVGNGWYRCTVTRSVTINASTNGGIISAIGNNQSSYTGTSGSGIYVWGAQVVEGSTALPYFRTETRLNIPRLDYSNGNCPSLLVEPQRTNLALRSEEFDNVYWVKNNVTVTGNSTNSPNGTLTSDRLVDTATTGEHNIEKQITITAGTNTLSVFVKKDNNRYVQLAVINAINSSARFVFDFDTKAITSFGAIGATVTYVSSSINELSNGWFKLSLTYTSSATNPFFAIALSNSPNVGTTNLVSYTGDGTKGV